MIYGRAGGKGSLFLLLFQRSIHVKGNLKLMLFIILGISLLAFLIVPLLVFRYSSFENRGFYKGFGSGWTGLETFSFSFLILAAATRGVLLLVLLIAGPLLLAYGIAVVGNASLPSTLLYEGIAAVAILLSLIWWQLRWWISRKRIVASAIPVAPPSFSQPATSNARPLPPVIRMQTAPQALQLDTPYTIDTLTLTVHSYHKRQSFRPIPNRFQPGNQSQVYPETWFIEFACTIQNTSVDEIDVWARIEEVLPDNSEPRMPRSLRQFLPLSDDENMDIVAGSRVALFPKQHIIVKTVEKRKFFFKLDENMNLHTVVFFVHTFSSARKQFVEVPLFRVEV
jgi:hypothetical protein